MAKYLVETYYTCTFKVNHYLEEINETELKNLEKRDDGKFEILEVKLDNRKTKNLDSKNNTVNQINKIDVIPINNFRLPLISVIDPRTGLNIAMAIPEIVCVKVNF